MHSEHLQTTEPSLEMLFGGVMVVFVEKDGRGYSSMGVASKLSSHAHTTSLYNKILAIS